MATGRCDAAARAELDAWLNADPRHEVAFERESLAWERTERLRALRPQGEAVDDLLLSRGGWRAHGRLLVQPKRWRSPWQVAAAAVLCVAAAGGGFFWGGESSKAYATAVGERRVVVLDDGSNVELNTNTRLLVRMTRTGRRLKLVRGEALFHVLPDRRRPFVLATAKDELRGLGGAFAVRLSDEAVKITVVEGQVDVSGRAGPSEAPFAATLAAGAMGVYGRSGVQSRIVAAAEADRALSWRYGAIVLAGENLRQAAAEFNRYNQKQLIISDPSIEGLRLGGYFRENDVDGFARALQSSFDVKVTATDQAIYLSRSSTLQRRPSS